ncbi:phosphoribosylglycinamide formyltransferase, partial [Streptomyces solincola]
MPVSLLTIGRLVEFPVSGGMIRSYESTSGGPGRSTTPG